VVLRAPIQSAIFVWTFIIKVNTNMGRPSGRIQKNVLQMRVSDDFLRAIDRWRRQQKPPLPRSKAIRQLVELALKAKRG
jgi:hypothetical protein